MRKTTIDRTISIAKASEYGFSRQKLAALLAMGKIDRVARGIYAPLGYASETGEIEILACRGCEFVVALESALRFHGIATTRALNVTIALKRGARTPAVDFPLQVVRLGPKSFDAGIEEHFVNGFNIRVYSAAKTVADLFMFRNKVGQDLAKEALRDGYYKHLFTVDELTKYACINRVTHIITPYVDALFA